MHMVVDVDDLIAAHQITGRVEECLESCFGPVRCTIHLDIYLEPRDYAGQVITFRGTHG